ncbi:MAG: type I glyceraldehyde-3-phosphate dehydrogenase [Candidatus Woesearchaeota archaeon]|jgi:glyceraldehyde 3-phosphate dehydrogenase|nr:type I glyceraldehyde-3-phosphate dehydrogenase [Candidatus Woesearchaeota archaeon]
MKDNILSEIKEEISSNKKVRVAINGFGRIGRMIFRAGFNDPNIEFVAINDLSGADAARYFLQYDSAQGQFPTKVEVDGEYLVVGDRRVKVLGEKDIEKLPWKDLDIDVVAECTGRFVDREQVDIHIKNGAKKVVISAPGKGDVFYLVRGVNDEEYKNEFKVVSNGSCTTNSMSAIVNELYKKYGIEKGMFATIHSVTGDQRILDSVHPKLRRGRAAPFNIVPTSTGAAQAVIKLIPELEGKLHGIAYRVPTITGSITDLNLELKKNITKEEINSFLKEICSTKLHGIVEYSEEELVSSDIIGNPHSGVIDAQSTEVVGRNLLKLAVWYDNEYGFSNRMIEVIKLISKK